MADCFPFADLSAHGKLNALYQLALQTQELTVALQDQITELTARVGTLTAASEAQAAALAALQTSVDAEQAQVAAAIALLTADNPDVAAALAALASVETNLGAASAAIDATKADVESTIPDAPPAP